MSVAQIQPQVTMTTVSPTTMSTPAAPAAPFYDKGLANTVAADTQMSFIDGGKGVLEYVGIDIDTLARNSTYEETVYLLWNRKLPTTAELDALKSALQAEYEIPDAIYDMIKSFPKDAVPMHALRTLVSALALHDKCPFYQSYASAEKKEVGWRGCMKY